MTAADLMRELEADPAFQARAAQKAAELERKEAEWNKASQPIVADLAEVGVVVDGPWDLVARSTAYPEALPVLLTHLQRGGYPDRVAEGLARALAVKPAVQYWSELTKLYRNARGRDEREGLAVALAAAVTEDQVSDLIDLVADPSLDSTRVHFVDPVALFGGTRGKEVLKQLRKDPVVGRAAMHALGARQSKREHRP
jgi:hypothetical protein